MFTIHHYYIISIIISITFCTVQPVASKNVVVVAPVKHKSANTGNSCAVKSKKTSTTTNPTKKVRDIRGTFFTDLNLHNKEAFDLLNQLWHSKAGWKHVNTKDGKVVLRENNDMVQHTKQFDEDNVVEELKNKKKYEVSSNIYR